MCLSSGFLPQFDRKNSSYSGHYVIDKKIDDTRLLFFLFLIIWLWFYPSVKCCFSAIYFYHFGSILSTVFLCSYYIWCKSCNLIIAHSLNIFCYTKFDYFVRCDRAIIVPMHHTVNLTDIITCLILQITQYMEHTGRKKNSCQSADNTVVDYSYCNK